MNNSRQAGNPPSKQPINQAEIPVQIGGRAVTSFNAGGVSVGLETSEQQSRAEQSSLTLAASRRGFRCFRTRNTGPRE